MTQTAKMLLMTWASVALSTVSHALIPASSSANPYQGIVDRNVFALKPPPPPPPPGDNTKPTGPKITLTGITTILGKRAFMRATLPRQNEPGKPPEPAKEESFMLKEGERQGEIEVLEINDKAGTVKVNNYGVVVTLDFEKDGAKIPSGPALAVPGAPPAIGAAPNTLPLGVPPKTGFNPSIPTRTLRLPTTQPAVPGASSAPSYGTPGYGTPSAQIAPTQHEPQLTGEAQALMMEAHRLANKGNPDAPPMPITELTPPEDILAVSAPGSVPNPGVPGNTNPHRPIQQPPRAPTIPPPLPQF